MVDQKFVLRINVSIQETDERGCWIGNQLEVRDQTEVKAASFLEVAQVLGRFHDLAQVIKKETEHA